jgi:hypothetical protein
MQITPPLPTERKETRRERSMRQAAGHPRLKMAEPSGKAFIIVGAKPLPPAPAKPKK